MLLVLPSYFLRYGVAEASTPHLDKLAAEGILFTAAHVQVCRGCVL